MSQYAYLNTQIQQKSTYLPFMQETVKIPLSKEIPGDPGQLKSMLYQDLLSQSDKIKELLVAYHFMSRERVYDVRINEGSLSVDSDGLGSFIVNYMTGLFNACADVDYNQREEMKIMVKADPAAHTALLTGEYIPEREPDEL
jgi:hypothetical protein